MSVDPITLRVVSGALRAACEEMGAVLIRAAHSANIKERRDASCALFDPAGRMVMQAEHIPVHLGAMPAAVEAVAGERHEPGVAWVLNDPYRGGTHLPDITVITPAFAADGTQLGFAASRAHHADVGGPAPGSMPSDSTSLDDEGVVIPPRPLDADAIEELVAQMRQPAQRRADLRAQLAANRTGVQRLQELYERGGLQEAMAETIDYAERRMRACIAALPDGTRSAHDVLEAAEGDLELRLEATVGGDELTLDFSGSAAQHGGNLNCPLSVTRSACWFAVRVLTDPDIPPTAGAYRPVTVIAPQGSLLNARPPAAVVAGNVETSSRVADLVLAAFGRALGQGTMNNLTLGGRGFTYYETLGGGQGACADAPGPSGVHVAMSNTLNTPVEALELEFPLLVTRYAIRRGSGGDGTRRGGDGVIRELEARTEMEFSLICERRRHAPPGAEGGAAGAPGRNLLDDRELPAKASGSLRPGQRLRIETPGGGGFGRERGVRRTGDHGRANGREPGPRGS
jgi:N-methylhydantoinase B